MDKEYRFRTLKDIFEQVPCDRMADCMRELGVLMVEAKCGNTLFREVGNKVSNEVLPELSLAPCLASLLSLLHRDIVNCLPESEPRLPPCQ